ncbi:hypothetical protein EDF57_103589 [Novosphingobium sp. PhB55]|uniref:hypothetical protein n=1 Tax=Novosphingobium sp. PhB55 TaxID=2485106 RepID=UPI0010649038|nr:hypothetical protein [Novosphingobium sp. PhB55]TDW65405.1 hypothetical protein EDF57_103589 [Novosphingobium sp. PhB55]
MSKPLSSKDWFGKSAAGLVFGFTLALGAAGLFQRLAGIGDTFFSTKGQFAMWLMSPVWALTLSFCFMFRTAVRAWLWLAGANLVVWAIVLLLEGPQA